MSNSNNNNSKQFLRPSKVILQAYLAKFRELKNDMAEIAKLGYTHVQISPVQHHCVHIHKWYRVYQPTGTWGCVGNSLGSEEDLRQLIKEADQHQVRIIVDVVLHHYTGCMRCNPEAVITHMPNVAWRKMKSYFVGPEKAYHRERFEMDEWGPKQEIQDFGIFYEHVQFLTDLVQMGVRGFRFDAAKHIPPTYLDSLCHQIHKAYPNQILFYSEVLDGSVDVVHEYTQQNSAADFPLTFTLQHAFSFGQSLKSLKSARCVDPAKAICLADCHDSILGDSYKFACPEDGLLALCFLLARGQASVLVPLVYQDNDLVKRGIEFFHHTFGSDWTIHPDSTDNYLIIERGKGLAVINKSAESLDLDHIVGSKVGPRTALFKLH